MAGRAPTHTPKEDGLRPPTRLRSQELASKGEAALLDAVDERERAERIDRAKPANTNSYPPQTPSTRRETPPLRPP